MRQKAFTAIEIMLAIGIFCMLMLGITTVFISGRTAWHKAQDAGDLKDQASLAVAAITKDLLRSGKSFNLSIQTDDTVTFNFEHPADGAVTYLWKKDPITGVGDIIRKADIWTRVVARKVSALSLASGDHEIVVAVTAQHASSGGVTEATSLTGRVVLP
jgi:type II secretory pathway pseudopilin PulG